MLSNKNIKFKKIIHVHTTKMLTSKKVIEEFNKRAEKRKGITKVLSGRMDSNLNKKFDQICKNFITKNFDYQLDTVIDVGIGVGRLAKYFSQKSHRLIGVDFADQMLELAKKYLKTEKNITLIYNNVLDIDFLPNYFDLGIVSLVLKHNNDKAVIKIIKKLKKWCKKILLIEHIKGSTTGSKISIVRDKEWYLKQFEPMKPKSIYKFKRDKDDILFCIFE
mgnify:CR=1 FL=1